MTRPYSCVPRDQVHVYDQDYWYQTTLFAQTETVIAVDRQLNLSHSMVSFHRTQADRELEPVMVASKLSHVFLLPSSI